MNLLLVEPEATGHHLSLYTRLIVRAAAKRGWHLSLLTTRRAITHPAIDIVRKEVDSIDILLMLDVEKAQSLSAIDLLRQQNRYYASIRQAIREVRTAEAIDSVYMVNLDYIDKILALRGSPFGPTTFSGMMMAPNYHRQMMGIGPTSRNDCLYEYLFRRVLALPTLAHVGVVDESFVEHAKSQRAENRNKLHLVPDVGEVYGSETREAARQALGIPNDKYVILVYGSLAKRKGISELIDAVAVAQRSEIAILLAGTAHPEITQLLEQASAKHLIARQKLFHSPGFHDDDLEYRVFRAADVVWLGYVDGFYGSSGVLYQAGSMGLPVIATTYGLIGWLTDRYKLGLLVDPNDSACVAEVIENLASNQELGSAFGQRGRILAHDHSAERFGNAVCDLITS